MNIAIIGAGLTGRLLAWQLLEKGCKVTLIDKDDGSGNQSAGFVAAAMLAPFSEALDAEQEVYDKGMQSIALWKDWSRELLNQTAIDISLNLTGSLVVAHRQDDGDYQLFMQRLKALNYLDQSAISFVEQEKLAELEPELTDHFDKACYLSKEGALDHWALYRALEKRLKSLQVNWQCNHQIDNIHSAMNKSPLKDYDRVIDCRGFGAVDDVENLRGVRGEVIRVKAPEVNLTRPIRLMHPRYKLYVCPKPNNEYVIGATQIESNNEKAITVRSSLELLSALYSLHTGFSEAEIIAQYARCRPAYMDNLPQVDVVSDRLLRINGLYRHGYLLSPSIVSEAVTFIMNKTKIQPKKAAV